jgi:hypothetical protein
MRKRGTSNDPFDIRRYELRHAERPIPLCPTVFHLLASLLGFLTRSGRVLWRAIAQAARNEMKRMTSGSLRHGFRTLLGPIQWFRELLALWRRDSPTLGRHARA